MEVSGRIHDQFEVSGQEKKISPSQESNQDPVILQPAAS